METQNFDDILHNVVCISNLNVRRIQINRQHKIDTRIKQQFDTVLLLTTGKARVCLLHEDAFLELDAPHILVLEKDKEYTIESLSTYVELYDIGALRHSTGDVVDPENLVRANYPFDSGKSLEDQ